MVDKMESTRGRIKGVIIERRGCDVVMTFVGARNEYEAMMLADRLDIEIRRGGIRFDVDVANITIESKDSGA